MSDLLQRAQALIQLGRVTDAEAICRDWLSAEPDNGLAYAMLALCLAQRGELKQGQQAAQRATGLAPEAPESHFALASVLMMRNDMRAAVKSLDRAIKLSPADAELHSTRALALVDLRKWERGLASANRALELDPENVDAGNVRALALRMLGRAAEELETLQSALSKDPENSLTHLNTGHAWLLKGDNRRAELHFREALRLDPELDNARDGIAASWRNRFPPSYWAYRFSYRLARMSHGRRFLFAVVTGAILWFLLDAVSQWKALGHARHGAVPAACWIISAGISMQHLVDAVLVVRPRTRVVLRPRSRRAALTATPLLALAAVWVGVCFVPESQLEFAGLTISAILCGLANLVTVLHDDRHGWPVPVLWLGSAASWVMAGVTFAYGNFGDDFKTYMSLWKVALYGSLAVFVFGCMTRLVRVKR